MQLNYFVVHVLKYMTVFLYAVCLVSTEVLLGCPESSTAISHHEQEQTRERVLQRGGGRLHLHSFEALPEPEAHRIRGPGDCLVTMVITSYTEL